VHESPLHPGLVSAGRPPQARRRFRAALPALVALLAFGALAAAPRALRPPRDPAVLKALLDAGPHAGDCSQCHTAHADEQPDAYPNALVGPNDNALCEHCHATDWAGGSFGGDALYRGTGHGSSTAMIWPGPDPPMRIEPDAATKCLNCHDPHGWTDALGAIPELGLQREEKLCLTCHDGSPASTDIASALHLPYRHPTADYTGRHSGPLESQPTDFGVSPVNNRHAECEDCHDPHVSRADAGPLGNEASKLTLGASRVLVSNGVAGSRPLYTFVPGSDTLTTPDAEYQLCFKCHSSWTTQPAGQTDLALALNPANPSIHPVEDTGRNPMISVAAFAPGWTASSITRCGDCHGADFGSVLGPHGSVNQFLLRRPSPASADPRTMGSNELCFLCHSYDVYANPASPASVRAASRWNAPTVENGHAEHVGSEQVPCWACHVTHGSSTLPYLMVTGRSPGLLAYTSDATGGSCTTSCHVTETYRVNYAR